MKKSDMIDGDQFARIAKELNLYYVATHELRHEKNLVDDIRAGLPGGMNVLSANSDGGIPAPGAVINWFDFEWKDIPSNVNKWFAQNADVRDERLIPIPIGLECDRWYPPSMKKDAILATPTLPRYGTVYMNHTKRNPIRSMLYDKFADEPWVTTENMDKSFPHYARQLASHAFTFSPDGNGYDCCRTWEALYLGCIPIVQRHVFTEEFAKILPILIVDDWDIVTKSYLDDQYHEITQNWDALKIQYWEDLMRKAIA